MNKKNNNFKKILTANWLLFGSIFWSIILMFIGWFNTYNLNNWICFYSWSIFIFTTIFSTIYNAIFLFILGFKIRIKIKREKSKNSEIKINFLKTSNLIHISFLMVISFLWIVLGFSYFINVNLIQAIFIIIFNIFLIFYISYCFYYQSKIKFTKIKIEDFLENDKGRWRYLRKIDFDSEKKD